ncbi:hypothetical protein BBJ28_00014465 [Nothophytophthora sp. Chile5]|nr:hypothetical protein BBJ28_00014465 [Nothophytophthora sp. Chile5]
MPVCPFWWVAFAETGTDVVVVDGVVFEASSASAMGDNVGDSDGSASEAIAGDPLLLQSFSKSSTAWRPALSSIAGLIATVFVLLAESATV